MSIKRWSKGMHYKPRDMSDEDWKTFKRIEREKELRRRHKVIARKANLFKAGQARR